MNNNCVTKITVLMPSLNVAGYIDEAIKSVRQQSLKELEIICLDAGSDDGTVEIIERHQKEDSRIKFVPCEIRSYGYQLNLGMSMALGEYIGIVETDDYIDEKMYETLYGIAKENDCDYIKADYAAFYTLKNGEKFFLKRKSFDNDDFYARVLCPKEYEDVVIGDWYNWQGIYSSRFLKENGISFAETPGAAFQDIGFLYQTMICAKHAEYIKDSFYRYRIDRDEASSNSGKGVKYSYMEFKRLVEKMEEAQDNDPLDLRTLYLRMGKSFLTSYGDFSGKFDKISSEERQEYYCWFRTQMKYAISSGIIGEGNMDATFWKHLNLLLESEETFKEYHVGKKEYWKRKLSEYKDSEIIIFGSGNYGRSVRLLLDDLGMKNEAYLDNNEQLWGRELDGVPILAPDSIKEQREDALFIVANAAHFLAMKNQLLSLGVKENRIVVFNWDEYQN